MKKRALQKDFRMEVKRNFMRFLSILLIVALGVAFFSGLRACKEDMLDSADQYYDEINFMDISVASTMGITDQDLEAIRKIANVIEVEGAYVKDALVALDQQDVVVKTFSNNERVNQFFLIEGRKPQADNECMADSLFLKNNGYQIGDTITLFLEEEEIKDSLREVTLTIVGSCNSAKYLSFFRGTGEIGNGSINGFLVLNKTNYTQDVYSEAYVQVAGAKETGGFGEKYSTIVEQAKTQIEAIASVQCQARYDEVMKQPLQDLEDGFAAYEKQKADLDQNKAAAEREIDKFEAELAKANEQLKDAEKELEEKKDKLRVIHYGENDIATMLAPIIAEIEAQRLLYEEQKASLAKKQHEIKETFEPLELELTKALTKLEETKKSLSEVAVPQWYVGDREWVESYVSYRADAERMDAIAKVFPALFFFVAALVCLTTMTRMVDEQRTQMGILKALGYSKAMIMGKFMKYCFLATLLGSILGALIGQKLFPYVIITAYQIMYQGLVYVVTDYRPYVAVMAGLLAIACTLVATYFACMKDLKAEPAQLMRPAAPKAGKRILLERIPFFWNAMNFTMKATLRNLFRYKKRFLMTTIGIAGCMGLIIVGFGIKDSIGVMSKLQYEELWLQDAEITLENGLLETEKETLLSSLKNDEAINHAQLLYQKSLEGTGEKGTKSVTLYVMKDTQAFQEFFLFRDRSTKVETRLQDDGVILTEKYANMIGARIGDIITLDFGNYQKVQVHVHGIAENYLSHYIFMTDAYYQELMKDPVNYNSCLLRTISSEPKEEEVLFSRILAEFPQVLSISSTRDLSERIDSMLESLNIITYVLIISAGLLAFIVLYNLSNININERKRELASLKVLGFYPGETNAYVMRENLILTMLGILFGIGLGKVLHRFVMQTVEIDQVMFGRLISPVSYVYSAAITFGFSLLICFFTYFKLKKIDMIESLKSVE